MPASRDRARARNSRIGLAACVAAAAAVLIFGGGSYLLAHSTSPEAHPAAQAQGTMQLAASSYASDIDVTGIAQSASTSTVSVAVSGTICAVAVSEGDEVAKGDLLLTLENSEVEDELAAAQASYQEAKRAQAQAQDELDDAQVLVSALEKVLANAEETLEDARQEAEKDPEAEFDETPYQEAVDAAQAAVDDAQASADLLDEALVKARKDTAKAKSALTKVKRMVAKLSVTSPQSGVVTGLSAAVGDEVSAEEGSPLMTVIDPGNVCCAVQVPESKVGNIAKGQTAIVSCSDLPGTRFEAVVFKVADAPTAAGGVSGASKGGGAVMGDASSNGTYYEVTLVFDASPAGLEVGMAVTAHISVQDFGTVYYVPASAVASGSSGMYVEALIDETTVKQCSVTQIGITEDGRLVVQGSSLAEGMTIRTDLSGA